jgi:hypothetical protein
MQMAATRTVEPEAVKRNARGEGGERSDETLKARIGTSAEAI